MTHDTRQADIGSAQRPIPRVPSDPCGPGDSERTAVNAYLERIVTTYADLVVRLAYARLGSRADAQDVCQTVLLKLLRASRDGSARFRSAEHEKAWVIRTTINACIDERRRRASSRVVSLDALQEECGREAVEEGEGGVLDVADEAPSPGPSSGFGLGPSTDESSAEVLDAVNTLPPSHRQAVYLRFYEGYSIPEIAELTGEREATIRKRLSRAYAKLRDLLEGGVR